MRISTNYLPTYLLSLALLSLSLFVFILSMSQPQINRTTTKLSWVWNQNILSYHPPHHNHHTKLNCLKKEEKQSWAFLGHPVALWLFVHLRYLSHFWETSWWLASWETTPVKRKAGGWLLGCLLDCVNSVDQRCFPHHQNLTWNGL